MGQRSHALHLYIVHLFQRMVEDSGRVDYLVAVESAQTKPNVGGGQHQDGDNDNDKRIEEECKEREALTPNRNALRTSSWS